MIRTKKAKIKKYKFLIKVFKKKKVTLKFKMNNKNQIVKAIPKSKIIQIVKNKPSLIKRKTLPNKKMKN